MPTHWTYEELKPGSDLFQGDIIDRTPPFLEVLSSVHGYFSDPKYIAFIIISQTCDLVVRNGDCKARYINLAVVRSLEDVLPELLDEECGTRIPGVLLVGKKTQGKQLVERIINQNEQSHGLLYLHPDADVKIAVPSVALLRVSFALRAKQHYETLRASRVGRLETQFRNKLGWLSGNLFSRIDTVDWPEKTGAKASREKVDTLLASVTQLTGRTWIPESWIHAATAVNFDGLSMEQAVAEIRSRAPQPPYDIGMRQVQTAVSGLLAGVTQRHLLALVDHLESSAVFAGCDPKKRSCGSSLRPLGR